jgi:hypothetical protein
VADAPPEHVPAYLAAQRSRYAALVAIGTDESGTLEADLRSALDRFRALGYPYWLARSQADLGRWLESQDRREEGIQLFAAAHKTFATLGVRPEADTIRTAVGDGTLRRSQGPAL